MSILIAVGAGLLADLRETLPSTTDEAGAFVAGFAWAFVIFWTTLIVVTLAAGR
jgi:hypothetical protein